AECPGGLNLEDVEHFAAEPASHQHLIRTLLEAIGDGAETLAFEPLGQICSLKRRVAGQMLETIPLPVPAHDVGLVLAGFSRGAMDEREKLWVAELPLQLAQAVQSASLRISTKNDVVVGTVRLPRGERISLQARRLLRDFADFIGEQWNMPCQVTVLCRQARPEAAGKD